MMKEGYVPVTLYKSNNIFIVKYKRYYYQLLDSRRHKFDYEYFLINIEDYLDPKNKIFGKLDEGILFIRLEFEDSENHFTLIQLDRKVLSLNEVIETLL